MPWPQNPSPQTPNQVPRGLGVTCKSYQEDLNYTLGLTVSTPSLVHLIYLNSYCIRISLVVMAPGLDILDPESVPGPGDQLRSQGASLHWSLVIMCPHHPCPDHCPGGRAPPAMSLAHLAASFTDHIPGLEIGCLTSNVSHLSHLWLMIG